jgi:hypothetical protein
MVTFESSNAAPSMGVSDVKRPVSVHPHKRIVRNRFNIMNWPKRITTKKYTAYSPEVPFRQVYMMELQSSNVKIWQTAVTAPYP